MQTATTPTLFGRASHYLWQKRQRSQKLLKISDFHTLRGASHSIPCRYFISLSFKNLNFSIVPFQTRKFQEERAGQRKLDLSLGIFKSKKMQGLTNILLPFFSLVLFQPFLSFPLSLYFTFSSKTCFLSVGFLSQNFMVSTFWLK